MGNKFKRLLPRYGSFISKGKKENGPKDPPQPNNVKIKNITKKPNDKPDEDIKRGNKS